MKREWGWVAFLLLPACGATADPSSGTGGADPSGGSDTLGTGGAASESGGAPGGGAAATGGTPSSGGTSGCPPIAIARVLPIVGPFFMGPDPGPCSQTSSDGISDAVYTYEGELVASSTLYEGETYVRDDQQRLIAYQSVAFDIPVVYEEGAFVEETAPGTLTRYELDELGYLLRAIRNQGSSEELVWEYQYEDCRLVRRAPPPNSEHSARVYSYDAVGHISSYTEGESVITFDYSCWN